MQRELVIRARNGDCEAFATLARKSVDRLYGVALRILRDRDRADDATQQALIAAWDHLDRLRDPDRFEAWTHRLVVRAAYHEARHERSQHDRARMISMSSADPDPLERVAQRDELEKAFRRLSPEHRAVLVLHHYADLPLANIAEILEVPLGTVGSRLHHASRRMRAALERENGAVVAREHALR